MCHLSNEIKKVWKQYFHIVFFPFLRAIDLYFPAHAVVYKDGLLEMPSKVKWFNSKNEIHGTIGGLTELTLIGSTLDLKKTSKSQVRRL